MEYLNKLYLKFFNGNIFISATSIAFGLYVAHTTNNHLDLPGLIVKWGYATFSYGFTEFIKDNIPKDAKILIPVFMLSLMYNNYERDKINKLK